MDESIVFTPIGGIGNVTRNMYVYENQNEMLLVDCGLGFPDESLPGVDFLIPDISYLKKNNKKIVGMVLTHGHEDHIGALPFILPALSDFPIFGSQLTASFANEKLKEFGVKKQVNTVDFKDEIHLGIFTISFIRMTHSIIDAANLVIKTNVGNFYHASDFKFDFTPVDSRPSEVGKIAKAGQDGILCLFSDCLGSEREGYTPSELKLSESFEDEFRKTRGKIFVTTYSSNISRLNQAIEVALKLGRKICFMGRSLLKARDIGRALNYMKYPHSAEIRPREVKKYNPASLLILVAGSQAQEGSALMRIASGEDRDIQIDSSDTVIFSADPIPGNEVSIYSLIDTIAKRGAKVVYSGLTDEFHVSGHGSSSDLKLMISLTKPQFLLPISGTYRQMVAYKEIAKSMGYKDQNVFLIENGQQMVFGKNTARLGQKLSHSNIFVDEITGRKIEHFVVMDRVKIAQEGIMIVIAEIDAANGQLVSTPDILTRGFVYEHKEILAKKLASNLHKLFAKKKEPVANWYHVRDMIGEKTEALLFQEGREPLVIPVVLEV